MHEIGLLGGTFDRFHAGHEYLIRTALSNCKKLEIWLTNDQKAQSKDLRVKKWDVRSGELLDFVSENKHRVSINILEDDFGPAQEHKHASVIFCTEETLEKCESINNSRLNNRLKPLEIISVGHVGAWDGNPISSSRIRSGVIDRRGQPWIPDSLFVGEISLSETVENQLKEPFGQLISGSEANPKIAISEAYSLIGKTSYPLISVGDVTTLSLQKIGVIPDVAVIDGMTKRENWPEADQIVQSGFTSILHCTSPAGKLTNSLFEACKYSIMEWKESGHKSLIIVDGEEDLAPLILHPLSPIGSVILYGQPGKGIVIRWCDEESKERCRNLLSQFEINQN
ncbi:MAG: hypothetical protein CMA12_02515 [Euryarchaeota archaeon]|nr:hypothetical protein [Euryarchaeota archaeon]OUW22725.1 MAG: hypothetical protein CBD33_01085 [Euryarchaeota archaeon TMED173]